MKTDFIIVGNGRTGSTYLTELMDSHPDILCLPEIIEPHFHDCAEIWESRFNGVKIVEDPVENYCSLRNYAHQNNIHFGFKFLFQNEKYLEKRGSRFANALYHDRSITKIVVHRNLLETYISNETGLITNKWAYKDTSHVKIGFDYKRYSEYCNTRLQYYFKLYNIFGATNQRPIVVNYESICSGTGLQNIWSVIGVRGDIAPQSKTVKQNPKMLCDRVVNFDNMIKILEMNDDVFLKDCKERGLV